MVKITELNKYVFNLVKQSGIPTYEYRGLDNQKGTFIIVAPLALVGRLDQSAVVNVNIYTDNLKINISGQNDFSQPNAKEIQRCLDLVQPLIENNDWSNNVLVNLSQASTIYEKEQTIINLRLNYRKINY